MKAYITLALFIIDFIISGSGSSLALKAMSEYEIAPGKGEQPIPYNHPYVETVAMFIGETLCLLVYYIETKQKGKKSKAIEEVGVEHKDELVGEGSNIAAVEKRPFELKDFFKFAIPTICDLVSATLFNMSIYYSDVSVYEMLRNMSMIFVAIISACIWRDFRKKFDLGQWIGIALLLSGVLVVSYATVAYQETEEAKDPILGIFLVLVGTIILAMFYITEEIFLRKISLNPLLGVGCEGCWGLIFNCFLLPLYNYVKCPWSDDNSNFEDLDSWAYEVFVACKIEILFHLLYICFTLMFNEAGMELTNRASASFRTTFDSCRTIVIFVLSLCFGWEKWHWGSSMLRILGFVFITTGVLIYNNIWVIIPYIKKENAIANKGKWIKDIGHRTKDQEQLQNKANIYEDNIVIPGEIAAAMQ